MIEIFETLAVIACQTRALHVFYRWAETRLFPPRPPVDLSHLGPEERRRRAIFANRLGTALYMAAWPVVTVGWFALFASVAAESVPRRPGVAYVFVPVFGPSVLVAFTAGFVLCGPAGLGMLRLCLGRRYHEDMACGDAHFDLDIRRFMYAVFVWIIPLCIDWELLHANCYTLFTDDAMIVKDFLGTRPVAHPFRDVVAVYGVKVYKGKPGAIFPDPNFKVVFKDGTGWVPIQWWHGAGFDDRAAVEFVAKRSRQAIRWVDKIE